MLEKRIADVIANTWLDRFAHAIYNQIELTVMRFYKDPHLINLIKQIRREDKQLFLKPSELALIHSLATAQRKVPGEYAEVGVYRGGSAKIICSAKGNKPLHLFDTFTGIPHINEDIDVRFSTNMFVADITDVAKRLQHYNHVHIHQGYFPNSARPLRDTTFSFVHLDVDVYQSTADALEFFYPRLTTFAIILSHDYSSAAGVKKAFDEFFHHKPESIIQLPMSQCIIIKR